ncbi:hypothetical protein BC629DRAFT_915828 [Irpex lacteus]|nr:hypothetical protein BC629DRAFT_915828 [Irpex lacteus]
MCVVCICSFLHNTDRSIGHGALWMAGLHHRDISEGNLMYTIIDGEISGVVNDFDLAIIYVEGQDRKTESERTGTRIFMAAKLVENLMNNKEFLTSMTLMRNRLHM